MGNSVRAEVEKFRIGYVADPVPGHDMYKGMLAIPYMRWSPGNGWSVISMRFRCIEEGCPHDYHGKYNSVVGDSPRLFNTLAIQKNQDAISICEGEIDAVTATVCGFPSVGIAGVESWKDHFTELFRGYETVNILADGDDAGMRFAQKVKKAIPNGIILPCEQGEDVNSEIIKHGAKVLVERMKR